jgi:hypothetical protein
MPRLRTSSGAAPILSLARPPTLEGRAIDNLRFIRETMERSRQFTALPGTAGIAMGATALLAAALAARSSTGDAWIATWLAAAAVCLAIGVGSVTRRARKLGVAVLSGPGKGFVFGLAPGLFCGAAITAALYRHGAFGAMPATWMLLYGCALLGGGTVSLVQVRAMGLCFLGAGTIALALPLPPLSTALNWEMGGVFGGLHLLFGLLVARGAQREEHGD